MKQVRTWAGLCTGAALLGSLWLAEPALAGPYVMRWGFDNGDAKAHEVPTSVMSNVSSIAAGYRHSLAVKDGRAWAWGDNSYLQTNVPVIAQSGVTNVAGGYSFSLALKTNGSVQAWGADIVKTNVPNSATSGVTKIAAGEWHALALKNGGVLAWGSNSYGQTEVPPELTSNVMAISAGAYYSVALKTNGSVQVFGIPATNALAYGIRTVPAAATSGVTAISAGYWHALALKNGGVIAWGGEDFFDATNYVPAAVTSGVTAISAGYLFNMALKTNGTVVVWGDYTKGQLPIPNFAAVTGITQIAAGEGHCLVVTPVMLPRFTGSTVLDAYLDLPLTNSFVRATGDPAVTYHKDSLWPPWLTLNSANGVLGGTPTNAAYLGINSFNVIASNSFGKVTSSPPYQVNVRDALLGPPVFYTTNPLPSGVVGAAYSMQFNVSNSPTFSVVEGGGSGLPPGLTLSTNGLLSGTPTALYDSFFTVSASNFVAVSNRNYNITINDPTEPPVFVTESPLTNGVVGQFYSLQIVASNNPSFSLVDGEGILPDGLSLDPAGLISGTPTQIENPTFTVRATNVVGGSNRVFSLEIFGPPVIVTDSPLPDGVVGMAYSNQISATGDPLFSVVAGSPHGGLGLTSSGWVTGTPTTVGTSNFTVRATNAYGWSDRGFALTIAQVPVFFTTNPLPSGVLGLAYSKQIEASGDPTFSVVDGSLPGGLGLNGAGLLDGTPTAAGPFNFTVRATNAYGWSNRVYDLTIAGFDPPRFTLVRYTNGNVRMAWTNPNASGNVEVHLATNILVVPVIWSNFGVQTSPWTNATTPKPAYYRLRMTP